jgi:hypothetical protein
MSTTPILNANQSIKPSVLCLDSRTSGRGAGSVTIGRSGWELLILSFASLFLELAIIRWLSTEIRIFAYFKNLPLWLPTWVLVLVF